MKANKSLLTLMLLPLLTAASGSEPYTPSSALEYQQTTNTRIVVEENFLRFYTGGEERITVDANGNVGIGTSTSNSTLTILPGPNSSTNLFGKEFYLSATTKPTSGRTGFLALTENDWLNGAGVNGHFVSAFPFDNVTSRNDDLSWKAFRLISGVNLEDKFWVNKNGDGYFSGNVGVGTSNPTSKLEINGDVSISRAYKFKFLETVGGGDRAYIRSSNGEGGDYNSLIFAVGGGDESMIIKASNGNVGIGTTNPESQLDIETTSISGSEKIQRIKVSDAPNDYFEIKNATGSNGQFIPTLKGYHVSDNRQALSLTAVIESANDVSTQPIMTFDSRRSNGSVSTRPLFAWNSYGQSKMTLSANGNLHVYGTVTWPDYVFEDTYELNDIEEVEKYIEKNHHLPEIPSAAEVKANGIDIVDMQARLLQKIEELTLYVIELKKENEAIKQEVQSLKR